MAILRELRDPSGSIPWRSGRVTGVPGVTVLHSGASIPRRAAKSDATRAVPVSHPSVTRQLPASELGVCHWPRARRALSRGGAARALPEVGDPVTQRGPRLLRRGQHRGTATGVTSGPRAQRSVGSAASTVSTARAAAGSRETRRKTKKDKSAEIGNMVLFSGLKDDFYFHLQDEKSSI